MKPEEKYWYAFAKLTKISSVFVNKLFDYFGSIEHAWNSEESELLNIPELKISIIKDFIEERRTVDPQECLEYINERGIHFIHPESADYPFLLRHIDNPPTGLFVLGNLQECNLDRTLAVVGSRKASESAKNTLRRILDGFANTDICIVSGLAEGIDTVAHTAAVENGIKTIGVIGGGFDKLYPKSNVELFNKIINGRGAVMTEYWPDVDAINWHFPVRNRIVSGLSKGVLVAEAALRSGAMITARLALEQNKELMCMPGLIANPNTQGIYKLIKTGAGLVTETKDIIELMEWELKAKRTKKRRLALAEDEMEVVKLLKIDPLTPDELVYRTGMKLEDLMVLLTKLELAGIIQQTNGEKYIFTA